MGVGGNSYAGRQIVHILAGQPCTLQDMNCLALVLRYYILKLTLLIGLIANIVKSEELESEENISQFRQLQDLVHITFCLL